MLYVLFALLGFWVVCNLIVLIKWKPAEMWVDLVEEQTMVGRIFGNLFYLPYWLVHLLIGGLRYYVFKPIAKYIKIVFFAVLRFIQQIYHSIFDIL